VFRVGNETILVVDDDPHIVELAALYLRVDGYRVVTGGSGAHALQLVTSERPALIVLDMMLPGVDGWEVCRRLRARGNLPIIMLTARTDDVDKVVGLELGADDYVTKPFNPRELVARVKAVLRRGTAPGALQADGSVRVGTMVVDPARREAQVGERVLTLRIKEFDLLLTLAQQAGMVLSREQLLNQVWGYDYYGETRTVDVHVAHLRQQLADGAVSIETVWGVGYKLVAR
jgi:DNA-binding response OmpR family regulator